MIIHTAESTDVNKRRKKKELTEYRNFIYSVNMSSELRICSVNNIIPIFVS